MGSVSQSLSTEEQQMAEYLLIGETAKETGVTTKQLRHWADQEYIPNPTRVVCGERSYRTYSPQDIEHIKKLKKYLSPSPGKR